MPRIHIPGPYHIYFVSFDCHEPPHVHVAREKMETKIWLTPISIAYNHGFARKELNRIERLLASHQEDILEAWHEHCRNA
jgi:hypothetical protein